MRDLVFRYYDGDTDRETRLRRERMFRGVGVGFQPLGAVHDRDDIDRYLTGYEENDSLVLFVHLSRYTDAPARMRLWSQGVLTEGVVVFYSGGGIGPEEAREIGLARDESGMHGRAFVHLPPFDGLATTLNETVAGMKRFSEKLQAEFAARDGTLRGASFTADSFGWPGIAERCYLEYSLSVLDALLPALHGRPALRERAQSCWDQLHAIVQETTRYLMGSGQARANAVESVWKRCEELFRASLIEDDVPSHHKLMLLSQQLLGDGRSDCLLELLDGAWTGGADA
jgi:hypothetical protein